MDSTPPPGADQNAPATASSRRRGGGHKRKSTSLNSLASHSGSAASQTTSSKRQVREKPHAVPLPPIHQNGPCTRARVQPNHAGEASEVAITAEEHGGKAAVEDVGASGKDLEALEAEIEAEYGKIKSRDKSVHVVPVHAGWFSWMKIHPLEEKMMPLFFNEQSDSRTPEIYMDIRNWIVKKFHQNPNTPIELKDLSELPVGDVDGRQKVMEFLDYWGLINYHPFPSCEPSSMNIDANANDDEYTKRDSLVDKLFRFETIEACAPEVPKVTMETPAMSSGLFSESVVIEDLVKAEGPSVDYHCNSCSADCSRKRYHCQKQADFDLCADCFNSEKFGSDMSPSDFILMEPGEGGGLSGGNWTDQETLLLLEAIELFRDNWSEIAEHVATKTKAQCILHFVQMPIEDEFYTADNENDVPKENGPVSTDVENSSTKSDQEKDTTLEDVAEKTEIHGGSMDNMMSSSPQETSNPDELNIPVNKSVVEENLAVKALKEAFEAVGSSPSPGEKMSFAEVGNPVMTLAAFLARLVDPNVATASLRSISKSLSGNYSGEQLAAMHCFPLEDPPHDMKDLAMSERAAAETIEDTTQENVDKLIEKQRDKELDQVGDAILSLNNENPSNKSSASREHDEKVDDHTSQNQKPGSCPINNPADGFDVAIGNDGLDMHDEAQQSFTELKSNFTKGSKDGALKEKPSQSSEPMKNDNISSTSAKEETNSLVTSAEEDKNEGHKEGKERPTEKKEPLMNSRDIDIDKLKRAAVATLSAAALKAKILAEQEEDQILQLSTFLVEKQLQKLETKLALFTDIENIVMRVKEELDKSKQRLFHERAAIIALRYGNRPPPGFAPFRAPYPNAAALRTIMGMNSSLRPPLSRPMMTQNPTSSDLMMPSSVTSTSMMQNADKISSVDMK